MKSSSEHRNRHKNSYTFSQYLYTCAHLPHELAIKGKDNASLRKWEPNVIHEMRKTVDENIILLKTMSKKKKKSEKKNRKYIFTVLNKY